MKLKNILIVKIDFFVKNLIGNIFSKRNRMHGVGTGRVVEGTLEPTVMARSGKRMFVYHPYSISHSLWRSQEYSLINEHKHILQKPIFDLGCGDGSFSKILFEEIEYGVDPDNEALNAAKKTGVYKTLLNVPAENTGLPSSSVGSVFSNSVLEHTQNLQAIIKEMHRILVPTGKLMITVPNDLLTIHLTKLFGKSEANRMNGPLLFSHYNLLSNNEWQKLLSNEGFNIVLIQNYQSEALIESYRQNGFFVNRMVEKIFKKIPSNTSVEKMFALVKQSLDEKSGSCTFIIAEKI